MAAAKQASAAHAAFALTGSTMMAAVEDETADKRLRVVGRQEPDAGQSGANGAR